MRIVQITDIHRGESGRYAAGINVNANYQRTMAAVLSFEPDIIVCTGDLVCTPDSQAETEEMIADWRSLCDQVYVVPGNHDEVDALGSCLGTILDESPDWPFVMVADRARMVFLNTASGAVGDENRDYLLDQDAAAREHGEQLLIFMHHPPCITGCSSLDNAAGIVDADQTTATLEELSTGFHIFCGHFHSVGSNRIGRGMVHRTAAVSFQVPCDAVEFAIDNDDPCLRLIQVHGGETVTEHIRLTRSGRRD